MRSLGKRKASNEVLDIAAHTGCSGSWPMGRNEGGATRVLVGLEDDVNFALGILEYVVYREMWVFSRYEWRHR